MTRISSDLQQYDTTQGDVVVESGGKVHLHGTIAGTLLIQRGGTAQINGMIAGLHVEQGGFANLHGTCTGSVRNEGELTVAGVINGELTTAPSAQTTVVAGAVISGQKR